MKIVCLFLFFLQTSKERTVYHFANPNSPQTYRFMKKPLILGVLTLFAAMTFTSCNKVTGIFTGKKITEVSIEAGEALITDDEDGVSNIKISCNNGLVIKAEWKRNSSNEYGYDIYEPEVNQDYNRLTVMIMARRVIANYLNGEYDD